MNESGQELVPFSITFREPHLSVPYLATAATIQQIATDLTAEECDDYGGIYPVFITHDGSLRTLAIRFDDVLYIG